MKIFSVSKLIFTFCIFLFSCGCPPDVERITYIEASTSLFNNGTGKEIFLEADNRAYCPANNLGISVSYVDSLVSYEAGEGSCYSKKLIVNREIFNPPRHLYVYSTFPFLAKNPGDDLKEYFLISRDRSDFPGDLTSESFNKLGQDDFTLMLKPETGLEEYSKQQFVVEIQTDTHVLRDTTMTVILQ